MIAKFQIKRTIAREGLILLAFGLSGILYEVGIVTYLNVKRYFFPSRIRYLYDLDRCTDTAIAFLLYGYPVYLLIRFVIWAVKTLKEKT